MAERWTIQQLSRVVERILAAADYAGQQSGRVRAVPNLRTIRYYTTLGLVDKPAEMRGRRAFYTRRHALQLAAIKRLQANGHPLVDVQRSLAGATDPQLYQVAGITEGTWRQIVAPQEPEQASASPDMIAPSAASPAVMPTPASATDPVCDPAFERHQFWAAPPRQLEELPAEAEPPDESARRPYQPRTATQVTVWPNAHLLLEDVDLSGLDSAQRAELSKSLDILAVTLQRLGLARPQAPCPGQLEDHGDPDPTQE